MLRETTCLLSYHYHQHHPSITIITIILIIAHDVCWKRKIQKQRLRMNNTGVEWSVVGWMDLGEYCAGGEKREGGREAPEREREVRRESCWGGGSIWLWWWWWWWWCVSAKTFPSRLLKGSSSPNEEEIVGNFSLLSRPDNR